MCEWIRLPNGTSAIVCGGRHRRHRCSGCGRPATLQCDFPTSKGRTCDKHLCRLCAVPKGDNVDWCKAHQAEETPLFGGRF